MTDKKTEGTAAASSEKQTEARTTYSPTSKPDGKATEGKLVKVGDMVRSLTGGTMIDSLTLVPYGCSSWTEVEAPSAWLDGQVKAKKLEVRA